MRKEKEVEMKKAVTLAAMMRRASRVAEHQFDTEGEVTMFWVMDMPGEDGFSFEVPPMPNAMAKAALDEYLREFLHEHHATRYVGAWEAWVVDSNADITESLAMHPQRKEAVIIVGEDEHGQQCGMREIIRPTRGKPYLGKLIIETMDRMEGRFIGLLATATSAAN
jgi:hypothetical protein